MRTGHDDAGRHGDAPAPSVTVAGVGRHAAVPDRATVRLAAVHRAAGVGDAFAGVTSSVAAIVEIARRHTDAAHIGTDDLVVWPAHDNQGQQVGWECRHSLTVVVSDLAAAGALVTELAADVAERLVIDGVGLSVSDPDVALGTAREHAFADAHRKATQYAELAGRALGPVLTVIETGAAVPGVEPGGARMMAMKDAALEPGERMVTAGVTVTWALD